jgi:hypothetical protein
MKSINRLVITGLLITLSACGEVANTANLSDGRGYTVISEGNELRDQFNAFSDTLKLVFIVGPT